MTSGTRFNFRSGGGATLGAKIASSLFLGLFLSAGLAFCGFFGHLIWGSARTWFWQRTSCEILSSAIVEDREGDADEPYRFDVTYRYRINGVEHTSERFAMGNPRFKDYSAAAQAAAKFPAESTAVCYVNSAAPEEAVLQRGNPLILPFMLIPLVMVAFVGVSLYRIWRRPRTVDGKMAPISEGANKSQTFVPLFFGLFLVMGLFFSWIFFFHPLLGIWRAQHWRETPCRVISSEVRSHQSDDGTTYGVDILYEYEVGGRAYKSSRYQFMSGSSSGHSGKAAVVAKYPPGKQAVCYVNPANPTEAVIERGFTADLWFGLIPLAFVLIGVGGLGYGVRHWRTANSLRPAPLSARTSVTGAVPAASADSAAPRHLKPAMAPFGRLIAAILVAAFWNGIVSVFVAEVVRAFQRGRPEWFLTIFVIPFVLIGLSLIIWVGYSLLALFNPRPRFVLTPGEPRVGDTVELTWEFTGQMSRLERLEIALEGREEASYRRGTSTSTDKSLFARIPVATATLFQEMRQGRARVTVPAGVMHSFNAPNNKIAWTLRVHGSVPRWPDVREDFPVTIRPAPASPKENA